jgi:prolyl 4-hydroxylase
MQSSQKYDPHFDYFFHEEGSDNGGNRLVTILIYLTDVEEGGETIFPHIPAPKHQTADQFSPCAMQGLAVKPKKGTAAVFWSMNTAGELNKGSLHGSCPVIKGEKFSVCAFVRGRTLYTSCSYSAPGMIVLASPSWDSIPF